MTGARILSSHRLWRIVAFLALALALAGCDRDPGTAELREFEYPVARDLSPAELPAQDLAAIYSQVLLQVTGPDDTFGGSLDPAVVYVVRRTEAGSLAYVTPCGEGPLLSSELQNAVSAQLEDEPFAVEWVDHADEVELEPEGDRVANDGVIVTLSSPWLDSRGRVLVSGGIYIANLAAGSATYVVQESGGDWCITGIAGPRFVS